MTGFVGKLAITSIFDRFVACLAVSLVLWAPESLPACGSLCPPVPPDYNGLDAPVVEFGNIEAWRPEASMPRCSVGWLAWLAWLAGWLGWLAAAGGLLLAGCCNEDTRRSRRSADFYLPLFFLQRNKNTIVEQTTLVSLCICFFTNLDLICYEFEEPLLKPAFWLL